MSDFDCDSGYGNWGNPAKILRMRERTPEEQKKYAKQLWQENPKKYYEWKEFCIRRNALPDFFGTRDNPIPVDETKL